MVSRTSRLRCQPSCRVAAVTGGGPPALLRRHCGAALRSGAEAQAEALRKAKGKAPLTEEDEAALGEDDEEEDEEEVRELMWVLPAWAATLLRTVFLNSAGLWR